ncbi:MAG: hypothetical protein NC124_04540 [Clostridium sp.]|nr:hypothetical protein [Clostridium sp.]
MKAQRKKKIWLGLFAVFALGFFLISMFPNQRFHLIGSNLTGTITVTVNGQPVMPYHITCAAGGDREEKLTIRNGEDSTRVRCTAAAYHGYVFDYEVDTEDGTKHFQFMVMKTHDFGPRVNFVYQMNLNKEEEEWIAYVLLDNEGAKGEVYRILLREDETAYIQMGP